ncbi:hypothetical protein [Streptomyces niveus]
MLTTYSESRSFGVHFAEAGVLVYGHDIEADFRSVGDTEEFRV